MRAVRSLLVALSRFRSPLLLLTLFVVSIFIFLVTKFFFSWDDVKSPCIGTGVDQRLLSIADNEFQSLKLSGGFLVERSGLVLANAYCGSSNPATRTAVTELTRFNIGSLSKQFTGYLLLESIRNHLINICDPASKYLPDLRDRPAGKVSIEQLMKMRSGLPYILSKSDFLGVQTSGRIRSSKELADAIGNLDLEFTPGDKFGYSNPGYSLLGLVIAQANQSTWAEQLKKIIFDPFHMAHTAVDGEMPGRPVELAVGMLPLTIGFGQVFVALPHWNYSLIKGAGGIITTLNDLRLWNEALSKRTLLDHDWASEYFPNGRSDQDTYAYGWNYSEAVLANGAKIPTINHSGEDPGYCALTIRIPSLDAFILLTSNSDYCAFDDRAFRTFSKRILEYLASGLK